MIRTGVDNQIVSGIERLKMMAGIVLRNIMMYLYQLKVDLRLIGKEARSDGIETTNMVSPSIVRGLGDVNTWKATENQMLHLYLHCLELNLWLIGKAAL
jgi:hypothetical protein